MRIDAKIDGQVLSLEAPAGGGIEKGGISKVSEPDDVLTNITSTVKLVATHVGNALQLDAYVPPVAMEVQFSIRIDDRSNVSVGLTPSEGQFLVTLKFDA